jgi:hypothetical protein
MAETSPGLTDRMHQLANDGHPRATELREKADAFSKAMAATITDEPVPESALKSMLGAWARARRLWCDCTDEPLV